MKGCFFINTRISNRHKINIKRSHKIFFTYDDNNIIKGWNHQISIDTAKLKAYLSQSQIDELLFQFKHEKKRLAEDIFEYTINLTKEFGVYITLRPHNKLNATIDLHSKFTTNLNNNSSVILNILNRYKWYITRLDIAFDYVTSYTYSASLRRRSNQKQTNYLTGKNIGNTSNANAKSHLCHYDRLEKYPELETSYINRCEVRINFAVKERVTFANLNHLEIAKRLRNELFVPHLFYSTFTPEQKKALKESDKVDNEEYLKQTMTQRQYDLLRQRMKESRDELDNNYLQQCHRIYDFLLDA